MSMGIEMLVNSVMKSLGIDGKALINQITGMQQWVIASIQKFDIRLKQSEEREMRIEEKLDLLLSNLGVEYHDRRSERIEPVGLIESGSSDGHDTNADGGSREHVDAG